MRPFLFFLLFLFSLSSAKAQNFVDKRKTLKDSVFKPGDVIRLPVILFELNKPVIRSVKDFQGIDSLLPILAFLKAHPHLVVEISGHTDTRTSPQYSERLSMRRAMTVTDTLIKWGITPQRIVAKGYEGMRPLIPEVEIMKLKTKEEQEKAHQVNRRIEMKILRDDFIVQKLLTDSVFQADDIITCPRVLFDIDARYQLMPPENNHEADSIVDLLKRHVNLVVEVQSHSDWRGKDEINLLLTNVRARNLAEYLVKHGIDSLRVKYRGCGESRPFVTTRTMVLPSGKYVYAGTELNETFIRQYLPDKNDVETLCQLDRRLELKVLRTDFGK